MTKSLIDKYTINTRYQRSARIDTDWKNDIVKGYVLHETARNIVLRISEQLSDKNKPQKSFTITGPYGGGKSSLALIISNLVNANPREQKKTLNLFHNRDDRQLITKAFASTKKGWVIIRVVGSRSNPVESIFLAAKEAVKNRFSAIPKKLKRDQRINLKNVNNYHPMNLMVIQANLNLQKSQQ